MKSVSSCRNDIEEILENYPDENDSDYNPEKEIEDNETDSITSVETCGQCGEAVL